MAVSYFTALREWKERAAAIRALYAVAAPVFIANAPLAHMIRTRTKITGVRMLTKIKGSNASHAKALTLALIEKRATLSAAIGKVKAPQSGENPEAIK